MVLSLKPNRSHYLALLVLVLILVGIGSVLRLWGRVPFLFTQISIGLLAVYFLLLVGVLRRSRLAYAGLLVLAVVVILGNTATARHIEVIAGLAPPMDTLLVAVTGYVLQIPIAVLAYLELRKGKRN